MENSKLCAMLLRKSSLAAKPKATQATNAELTMSNHSPNAVFADIVNCQMPLCVFCSISNDLMSCFSCRRARIVDIPNRVAAKCENTGLFAVCFHMKKI